MPRVDHVQQTGYTADGEAPIADSDTYNGPLNAEGQQLEGYFNP